MEPEQAKESSLRQLLAEGEAGVGYDQ